MTSIRVASGFSLLLLAQAADPVSGGAGLFGAGLLGLVLGWLLLRHLPEKDRQIERLVNSKDESLKEIQAENRKEMAAISLQFAGLMRERSQDYKDTLTQILAQHRESNQLISDAMTREFKLINSTMENIQEVINSKSSI